MIRTQQTAETRFIESMATRATQNRAKMMSCANVMERLDSEIDLIALKNDGVLWFHIQTCRECRQIRNKNLEIKTVLKRAVKSEPLPNGLREKIQAALLKSA